MPIINYNVVYLNSLQYIKLVSFKQLKGNTNFIPCSKSCLLPVVVTPSSISVKNDYDITIVTDYTTNEI